jgi:putative hemolysin
MDFLVILILTLLNGAFAMSELALTASKKVRLQTLADEGDKGAQAALDLLGNPTQFLSVVQVGITGIGMLNAVVGEAAFGEGVATLLEKSFALSHKAAGATATALVVTAITFITILFGELVPKRIGQLYPEPVARVVARPMQWVAMVTKPFVRLLSLCTHAMLRLLQIDTRDNRLVTEAEISASLEDGVDAGIIEEHEHQMVRNVFHLDERTLTSLMVPRSDMVWLDASCSVAEALLQAAGVGATPAHSWYPVCRGSLDDVVGVVSVARMLERGVRYPFGVGALVEPAVFVPETLTGMELIEQFRTKSARMVMVVDEYGVVQGIITPLDVLEAITGELKPLQTDQAWAVHQPDGTWLLDGQMPVAELKARLEIAQDLPQEDRGRYSTLAGLLMMVCGHLPTVGEKMLCAHWQFEVSALEGRRIDKVLARPAVGLAPALTSSR